MFIEAYAYCEYGKEPKVFKSITKGTIAKEKSGKYGWSWDYIFSPQLQLLYHLINSFSSYILK